MLGQSLDRSDRILLTLSLVGALVFGDALVRDDILIRHFKGRGAGESVGRVTSVDNDVRRRERSSLTWYDAYSDEELFESDSLFTGPESLMSIEINGGRRIDLEENSLVVLRTLGNDVLLDLQLGGLASHAGEVKVLHAGQVTEVRAAYGANPVNISKTSKGSLTILSRSGEVEVGRGGVKRVIKPNESFTVDKSMPPAKPSPPAEPAITDRVHGPEKPSLSAEAPQLLKDSQKVVLRFKDGVDIRSPASVEQSIVNPPKLEWEGLPGARDYTLEIDSTPDFKNPHRYEAIGGESMIWREAKPGQYYWRVRAAGQNGEESAVSPASKLSVELQKPELKIYKPEDETVEDPAEMSTPKNVEVGWRQIPLADGYRVVASVDGKEEKNEFIRETSFELSVPPNSSVEVKVAAVDADGRPAGEFANEKMQFKRDLAVKAPEILLPDDNTTVVAFDKSRIDPLLFTWSKSPGAIGYELQFATDAEFRNVVATKNISSNKFILKERLTNGYTYWRVRSRFETTNSKWSAPRGYELQINGD